ncbi:unnamed protein product [Thlaspi arvense]|uniref:F-box/LRR-repeat protein 15/At3g58940/PEG3-like LRR domain-containing protein n=1 Tax=Thlaspi arvense TaxID=13288 RepID=A0AAU9R862_THLAR|nr:unnamed protein product [Thlaspi arvense]
MGRGLLELHLHAAPIAGVGLVTELLTSNTLVKLTISGSCDLKVGRVFLPALKSLSLLSVNMIDHPNYSRLVDGCPVLEDLFIRDGEQPGSGSFVESASIKRLVVFTKCRPVYRDVAHDLICFEAPSLVYLDYSSYVSESYEFIDLNLLVEVRLSLKLWESTNDIDYSDDDDDDDDDDDEDDDYDYDDDDDDDDDDLKSFYGKQKPVIFGDVTKLVEGICNITILHLSPNSLETFHFCCKSMPVFNNLLSLSIESHEEKGWQVMPLLLKSCPNLHTLAIKVLVSVSPFSEILFCCLWCPLLYMSNFGLVVSGSYAQSNKQMRRCMHLQP